MMYLTGAISLLKLMLWCTVGGTMVTAATDKDIHKLIGRVNWKLTKKVKTFHLGNEHATILGTTQFGKTYATIKTLDQLNEPVLFFNTNHTSLKDTKGKWVEGGGKHTVAQIIYCLEKGYKINYLPSLDMKGMAKQLKAITEGIYQHGKLSFRFAVDEVHLFKMMKDGKEGQESLNKLATTGLGKGYKMVFITQRPAMIDNILYTQSTKHILFTVGKLDESYLKENGFPVEEITKKLNRQKYHFVEFDQLNLEGPFMIG